MTACRQDGREQGRVGPDRVGARKSARAMRGDAEKAPAQPKSRAARWTTLRGMLRQVQAIGRQRRGQAPIRRDQKKKPTPTAGRRDAPRDVRAVGGRVVPENHRAPARQARQRRLDARRARLIGQEPDARKPLRFELPGAVC